MRRSLEHGQFRARVSEVADRGDDIEVRRSGVALTGIPRFAVAAKVNCDCTLSRRRERLRLLSPALLGEPAAVSQHNTSRTASVNVGVNYPSVPGR